MININRRLLIRKEIRDNVLNANVKFSIFAQKKLGALNRTNKDLLNLIAAKDYYNGHKFLTSKARILVQEWYTKDARKCAWCFKYCFIADMTDISETQLNHSILVEPKRICNRCIKLKQIKIGKVVNITTKTANNTKITTGLVDVITQKDKVKRYYFDKTVANNKSIETLKINERIFFEPKYSKGWAYATNIKRVNYKFQGKLI